MITHAAATTCRRRRAVLALTRRRSPILRTRVTKIKIRKIRKRRNAMKVSVWGTHFSSFSSVVFPPLSEDDAFFGVVVSSAGTHALDAV